MELMRVAETTREQAPGESRRTGGSEVALAWEDERGV
jgi:hypothetical protein